MINSFSGEYEFLSNQFPVVILGDDLELYPSVEHAFQARKTDDPDLRREIRLATTASAAKQLGRNVQLKSNWDGEKLDLMASLVKQKFTENVDLKIQLLLTMDEDLVQGNSWKDQFWGQDKNEVGENNLGKILMSIRSTIRTNEGSAFDVLTKFLQDKNLVGVSDNLILLMSALEVADELDSEIIKKIDPWTFPSLHVEVPNE